MSMVSVAGEGEVQKGVDNVPESVGKCRRCILQGRGSRYVQFNYSLVGKTAEVDLYTAITIVEFDFA